ncbi:MAG: bacteriohemerythrin [Acidiferrobacterales bacterium]
MAFLQWSPNLSVGIDFMDADHQKLMELLTELHDLVGPGPIQTAAVEKLDELIDFTQQHFRLEERLMEQSGYDGFEEHRQLHEVLLQEIAELRQHLVAGEKSAGPEIMDFLKDWLIRHILESDKQLGGFLQGRLGRGKGSKHDGL